MSHPPLPASLAANPRLDRWLRFEADGTVSVRSGKVEIGQGILTALAQVVAAELHLPLARVRMVAALTGLHPDEGVTSGSLSVQDSGAALRHACAQARELHLLEAARRWSLAGDAVRCEDGVFLAPDGRQAAYADLADACLLACDAAPRPAIPPNASGPVGTSAPRLDLPDKVFGRPRFIHDMVLPDMLHGRVLRPPNGACRLLEAQLDPVREGAGVRAVVQDGRMFGLLADTSAQADAALVLLAGALRWEVPQALPDTRSLSAWLASTPTATTVVLEQAATDEPVARTFAATYARPFVAHASLAPSCALARWDGDQLAVWSHTQGVYNLRRDLALAFGRPEADVVVQHVEGAGCYGHNGADDVAWDAAWLAHALPGRAVRLLWTRAGEFADAPHGPAGVAQLEADLDAGGRVIAWRHAIWSPGHCSRPGRAATPALLGSWYTADPFPRLAAMHVSAANGGGAERNAVAGYDFAAQRVTSHQVLDPMVRTSALRSRGALLNVFAAESFMDELAQATGSDPVEFRLRHLSDERARRVIERAVARAGWVRGGPRAEGLGWGMGYARSKGTGAWCAVVAQVEAGATLRVRRLVLAADIGLVVNPDGAAHQLEGGAIQATSVTLKEAVQFDGQACTSVDWESYPILRFTEVPEVEVELMDSGEPSLGAGEASFGPTAAAIANALNDALGLRVRELPLTPQRLRAAIGAAG